MPRTDIFGSGYVGFLIFSRNGLINTPSLPSLKGLIAESIPTLFFAIGLQVKAFYVPMEEGEFLDLGPPGFIAVAETPVEGKQVDMLLTS
ncbi:hypothetical protein MRB56_09905 [Halomonas cupida]|uniref:hypothetical protein n=1 Tax=Halomonas cupida TaxID=44933 RepID=UPI0039B48B7C